MGYCRSTFYKNIKIEEIKSVVAIHGLAAVTRFSYIRLDYKIMKSILITPKNVREFKFLAGLLEKLKISSTTLSAEELEDIGMSVMMKRAARSKKVSRESIMRKLAS